MLDLARNAAGYVELRPHGDARLSDLARMVGHAGIDRRAREHIFEKFYRVPTGDRQEVRGFGLGLYYARLVAQRHGGTIRVDSAPGRGTRFTITIPSHDSRS